MNARRWVIASKGICGGVAMGNLVTLPARSEATAGVGLALMLAAGFGWVMFDRELRRMAREGEDR